MKKARYTEIMRVSPKERKDILRERYRQQLKELRW
jgi:hypothetical protein